MPAAVRTGAAAMFLTGFLLVQSGVEAAPLPSIPYAYGASIRLKPSDFDQSVSYSSTNRVVATYFFYWYDSQTKAHLIDPDGSDALTDHPPRLEGFSYRSEAWHRRQLADMMAAGIDVVLPVFWGAPSEQDSRSEFHWSYTGLTELVKARDALLAEGKTPPRIGMFYDTSTLRHNSWHHSVDLTTDYGKEWFYATIRDFYSMVPPKHWAMIDGKPMVLLYSASFAKDHDQEFVEYTRDHFAREFGGRTPYLVLQDSWQAHGDAVCAWGGALGLKNPGVASLGPGYDDSAVQGRTPLVVPREGSAFYERNWERFLRRPSNLVTVETWNEFHEGTDICESREYGRKYIELTRKYADWFRQGYQPPWPKGPYTDSESVRVLLGATNRVEGLRQIDSDDGVTAAAQIGGREARAMAPTRHAGRYCYFQIDDSFKWAPRMDAVVSVNYFDASPGEFSIEYDGSDPAAAFGGVYTPVSEVVALTGSKTWKEAKIPLTGARFLNGQNSGADFRLVIRAPEFYLGEVTVRKAEGAEAKESALQAAKE